MSKTSVVTLTEFDTDFAFGLQFLQRWQAASQMSQRLHYIAWLGAPLSLEALQQVHALWPALAAEAALLQAGWPAAAPGQLTGFRRFWFAEGRVSLTLMTGDLSDCMTQCSATVHRFHVGATPVAPIARLLARLAAPAAILLLPGPDSAATAALRAAGFVFSAPLLANWQRVRPSIGRVTSQHAVVVGAGLAGAAVCQRLAERGWQLTLLERHGAAAQEASGNRAGIVMPLLSTDDNVASRLSRAAFFFSLQLWRGLGVDHAPCGVFQMARDAAQAARQQYTLELSNLPRDWVSWVSAQQASSLTGSTPAQGGWWFPQGGWADPGAVCRALLAACGTHLEQRYGQSVANLRRSGNNWQLLDPAGQLLAQAPVVIFATGVSGASLESLYGLPLQAVRGQITDLAADGFDAPRAVVCGDGYITPASQGWCSVGASYDSDDGDALRHDSQQENLQRLAALLPLALTAGASRPLAGRVGFRSVASDRLPLVGALPCQTNVLGVERLREVARAPGLYAALGFASRGLTWAPLAAELLAAQLCGEPLPIERRLADALDPARFMLQQLRRRTRTAC